MPERPPASRLSRWKARKSFDVCNWVKCRLDNCRDDRMSLEGLNESVRMDYLASGNYVNSQVQETKISPDLVTTTDERMMLGRWNARMFLGEGMESLVPVMGGSRSRSTCRSFPDIDLLDGSPAVRCRRRKSISVLEIRVRGEEWMKVMIRKSKHLPGVVLMQKMSLFRSVRNEKGLSI